MDDVRQGMCDSLIASLLSIKRGEVPDSQLVEKLESIKNSVDNFLWAAEMAECSALYEGGEEHGRNP